MTDQDRERLLRLVHDHVLGIASDNDEQELTRWAAADSHNAALLERMMERRDLLERYRRYSHTDAETAWKRFSQKHHAMMTGNEETADSRSRTATVPLRFWRWAAAAVAVIAVAGAAVLFMTKEHTPFDPQPTASQQEVRFSPATERAARAAVRTGRQAATITSGNQTYDVSTPEEYAELLASAPVRETLQLSTNASHEYWLTLSDGTRVHLDGNSTLTYPARFSDSRREVLLDGTAYIKVAPGEANFVVATRQGIVTDLGTEFLVNTHAANGSTEVVLFSGRVNVRPTGGDEVPLQPGQKAEMKGRTARLSTADMAFYQAWNEGEFLFNDTSMDKMMRIIEHWYGVDVRFKNPELGRISFTGSIDRYGTLQSILKAISAVTGLDITQQGTTVVVSEKE